MPQTPEAFPLEAPTEPEWTVDSTGFAITVIMLTGCPEGSGGVLTRYRLQPNGEWFDGNAVVCVDSGNIVSELEENDVYDVQIAWGLTLLGPRLSEWSDIKPVTIGD